ncbi:MAG: hypothetical protein FJ216_05985 [Ignavibacteria bacterium]|nr:hypothetical protein [Ignavibacteria bacterium]
MISRTYLKKIHTVNEYPCISVIMPAHRNFPDNQQDPIRLKNLITTAKNRLLSEFNKKDIEDILKELDELEDKIDFKYTLDGLALFVSRKKKFILNLPFKLKEKVIIDRDFHTRDLVFAMNRTQPYWFLLIGEKISKLYYCILDNFEEINEEGFPFENKILKKDSGKEHFDDRKTMNVERIKNYFRQTIKLLNKINSGGYPLFIAGINRNLSIFKDVAKNQINILDEFSGNYEKLSSKELGDKFWPFIKKNFDKIRKQIFIDFENAKSTRKYVSGIDEVWKVTNEGRGETLIVEEDFSYPAKLGKHGYQLVPTKIDIGEEIFDDAVDEIIENIIMKGGKVRFVKTGALKDYGRIALMLRF